MVDLACLIDELMLRSCRHDVCDIHCAVMEALYCRKEKPRLDMRVSCDARVLGVALGIRKDATTCVRSRRAVHTPLVRSVIETTDNCGAAINGGLLCP